jgi:hypothetical protein
MYPKKSNRLEFKILFLFETGPHYVAQTGFKLMTLQPQIPEFWDYRRAPPCTAQIQGNFLLSFVLYTLNNI